MKKQVKSKERVAERGEVFTAEREVKAMCDLVATQCDNVDATFLEPACGDGNFLAEILERKLVRVKKDAKTDRVAWEWLSVRAVASLYGVDIMQDNAEECRQRLFDIWNKAYKAACKKDCNEETRESVRYILSKNIICGNALTMMCVDENQQDTEEFITFAEFKTCGRMYMLKRRDYRLDVLLKANETPRNQRQLTLDSGVDDIDNYLEINPVTGEYMPKPLREYPPHHYRRLKENG
ncbi:MAG: hypothetical protein ACI4IX_01965 [Acutalibacteraceae bacterium]